MKVAYITAIAALAIALPAFAQEQSNDAPLSPGDIVNSASENEWMAIAPEDMLVMALAPDSQGKAREVVIQLMPPPFSQGWVENIRTLARAKWYDGISINRVQDNYVVQWGDPGHDNPEGKGIAKKPVPSALNVMTKDDYKVHNLTVDQWSSLSTIRDRAAQLHQAELFGAGAADLPAPPAPQLPPERDDYLSIPGFSEGWPVARISLQQSGWPVHCYGMVGVGRSYSPDAGSGTELYTVIGHAPRHLDRNIALVGRIISGMQHLSSLPRGTGVLGFYTEGEAEMRTPIVSVRVASDLPQEQQPMFEYLSTESASFAKYVEARANRRDPFFIEPAGGADLCNIPVPVRVLEHSNEGDK